MKNSIAIIGISFDLPNIKTWDDLKNALSDQTSFIDEMPDKRLKEIQQAFGISQMARAGYLDEVGMFDNEYFGFTEREALKMFPEHRLFLTHAIKAFYHAGYNESTLKGTKTGIFYNASRSAYHNYASVSSLSFNHFDFIRGIEATMLANYLDTHGPVMGIDTSCSSSLVAINAARQSLNDNECDMAIVGGVKTLALTQDAVLGNVVHSKKGMCKPFDQEADGMINGEGAIFFVLKKYEKALEDGDSILGEIKGIGINHGGSRIASLTAPSSVAQKEAIIMAWKNADLDIEKMRYIEAHGTGTILGDPIEIEGLKQAFNEWDVSRNNTPLSLSSFKGQVGHLDYLSGLAGLLRLVAAMNFKTIPVQANLKTLNAHFDLKDKGLHIPTVAEDWHSEDAERIGGVSSFGMTGTNIHVVASQKDISYTYPDTQKGINYLQISHSDSQKLKDYKNYLAEKINGLDSLVDIHKLCLKLNRVFQINKKNQAVTYRSKEELVEALTSEKQHDAGEKIFLLLDLDILQYSKAFIKSLVEENLFIQQQWEKHIALNIDDVSDQEVMNILFQYTLYKYLVEKLGGRLKFITYKDGSILNALIKSKITITQIIDGTHRQEAPTEDFNEDAFKDYVQKNLSSKEVVMIDFSGKDKTRFDALNVKLHVIDGSFADKDRFLLYTNMVESGVNPLKVSVNPVFNDLELPWFSPKRFWPEVSEHALVDKTPQLDSSSPILENNTENDEQFDEIWVNETLRDIWTTLLEIDGIKDDDDFFDMGGTSLLALDMIDEVSKNMKGVKIPYEEIYQCSTISKLSNKILPQLNNKTTVAKDNKVIHKLDTKLREDSYRKLIDDIQQERIVKQIPEAIFITGATGLLGTAVVDYLLNNTDTKLYCLVRKKEYDSSEQRFWSVFGQYYEVRHRDRVTIIEGDLFSENLGITDTASKALGKIDMIFHIAGSPQFTSKTPKNKHINFVGTKNIVDWANKNEIKKLSFISTVGIVGKTMPKEVKEFYETDTDLGQQSETLIHGASKLMAEQYIHDHYRYKSKIFRISNIGGRYSDGTFPTDLSKNLMWLKLAALSQLEFYCEELLSESSGIGFIPVDIISALLSEISFANTQSLSVYHIPRIKSFSNEEVLMSFKKAGISTKATSQENFKNYIHTHNHKMNFHQVAQKEITYTHRSDATKEMISKLDLEGMMEFNMQTYLERLVLKNLN